MTSSQRRARRTCLSSLLLGCLIALVVASGAGGAPGDATATQVADIDPGDDSPANGSPDESVPASLFNAGGTLLFSASDGLNGSELWKSNGGPLGPGGTEMVTEIGAGAFGSGPTNFANVGSTVFFSASDEVSAGFHGRELWKIDPPYTTPVMVEDINDTTDGANSSPEQFTNVNGTVFFVANDGVTGDELWKSVPPYDEASTELVEDINQNPTPAESSLPQGLTNVNGTLFFAADDGTRGTELWKSTDGTAGGTDIVEDIDPGDDTPMDLDPDSSFPDDLTNVDGTLFFRANNGTNGRELWSSGGTDATTNEVENIAAGAAESVPIELTNVNGTLFFRADDSGTNSNAELWKSPAPYTAGVTEIIDIRTGSGSSPQDLVNIGGTLYFRATGDVGGNELWKSNGGPLGPGGTEMVADINPILGSTPTEMTGVGGQIFFRANDGVNGNELWKTTGIGATMVASIRETPTVADGSDPAALTDVNGTLFFRANDGVTGRELWKATIEPPAPAGPTPPAATVPGPTGERARALKKCKKKKSKQARKKCKKKAKRLPV
jgi:ELWxxDGT repeat protein